MWLHVPSACSPSALGLEDSTSGYASPSATGPALWATSSGTPSLRPSSWQGWKTRPWIQRLSGTTLPPSTADAGVERWISSWAGSLASPRASQESDSGPRTSGGSGLPSPGSFATWDPASSSWKTCQVSLLTGSWDTFSETWPRLGSMRSGVCTARQRSAPAICESESSWWPTPDASASSGFNRSPSGGGSDQTPSVRHGEDLAHADDERHPRSKKAPRSGGSGCVGGPELTGEPMVHAQRDGRSSGGPAARGDERHEARREPASPNRSMADADSQRRRPGRTRDADGPERTGLAELIRDGDPMAHPDGDGLARERIGGVLDSARTSQRDDAHGRSGPRDAWPQFPPGPDEFDVWREYLDRWPEAEPAVRRGADGVASLVDRCDWADRVRACGNGVVPATAAFALVDLARRAMT